MNTPKRSEHVNKLSERQIEDAFIDFINREHSNIYKVLGRQIRLPMGILDVLLMGHDIHGFYPTVVEVKKGKVDERACGQLLGYMGQLNGIVSELVRNNVLTDPWRTESRKDHFTGLIIGQSLNPMAERVISTVKDISFVPYRIEQGAIHFQLGYSSFFQWWQKMQAYTVPDEIETVASGVRQTISKEIARTAEYGDSSDLYLYQMWGNDHNLSDLNQSLPFWPYQEQP